MKFSFGKLISAILFLGLLYFFMSSPKNKEGSNANDFSAVLTDGSPFSLSDLNGSYVLLDFWGSWCPPCRREMPAIVKLQNTYNGKSYKDAEDFHVVSVALEKDDRYWKRAADMMNIDWKYQIVRKAKLVLTDALALKYQVKDLPSKFLIDPNGQIIGANMKITEIESYLNKHLD